MSLSLSDFITDRKNDSFWNPLFFFRKNEDYALLQHISQKVKLVFQGHLIDHYMVLLKGLDEAVRVGNQLTLSNEGSPDSYCEHENQSNYNKYLYINNLLD